MKHISPTTMEILQNRFEKRFKQNTPISNITTSRVGGNAHTLITINDSNELAETVTFLWENEIPFRLVGAGSNVLFADEPFDGVILHNKAKAVKIDANPENPTIWAETGANLGMVGRKAALAGVSGLEWAAAIPGTVGGAVYGNAGAHGGDVNASLLLAEILQHGKGRVKWTSEDMAFAYRSSKIKRDPGKAIILSASFRGTLDDPEAIQERMQKNVAHRKKTQPPGASTGSTFKNPEGDYAGRLIEACGLKGTQIGGVKVSELHGNFFVNYENAAAEDYWQLIQLVRKTVYEKFNVKLELEIEPIGFKTNIEGA